MNKLLLFLVSVLFLSNIGNAQVNYNANGNSGFGGVVGNSDLELSDDGTTITGVFTKGSGDFNDAMVIYISTGATGRESIDGNVNDQGDDLRRAISSAGANASVINFPNGFEATHAIAVNQFFGGIWSIPATGEVGNSELVYINPVGNPTLASSASFTFSFDWSEIGLTSGDDFEFVITYLNAGNGFLSDEAYGDGIASGNPGSNDITFSSYFNYPIYYKYDNTWTPNSPEGEIQVNRDAIVVNGTATLGDNTTIRNLTVKENTTLVIDSEAVLNSEANIINDGAITFKSNATSSAQFDEFTGNISGVGSVNVERYFPSNRSFRFATSAVNSNSSILANWQENGNSPVGYGTHITGSTEGLNGLDATATGNPSLFRFNNISQTWTVVSNTENENLIAGRPYRLYVRGDRNINLENNQAEGETVLRASGSLSFGDVLVDNLSQTADNFSLIGNPYQAALDMSSLTFNNVDSNFYWVWDPNINDEGAYITVDLNTGTNSSTSQANQYLQPGQGAFVRTLADGAASVTFTETSKNVNEMSNAVFSEQNTQKLNLRLYKSEILQNGGMPYDALVIRFSNEGYNQVDQQDAPKLGNPAENMARLNGIDFLSIENRALPKDGDELSLAIYNYKHANYTFEADLTNFSEDLTVYLKDHYTGKETVLKNGLNHISFTVNASIPASADMSRFSITFNNTTSSISNDNFENFSLYPNPTNNGSFTIKTNGLTDEVVDVKINNMLGQEVFANRSRVESNGDINVNADALSSGIYLVKLNQNEQEFVSKLIVK
ncbi:T9SS type A sorting domain-containing protein [Psychroflexus aestuariivivens]|uniref:T9SS type A sorting domain-containing protein n=1 Tax=Psychroflexus aestuariivivens TaxID=1795040 RepID=UPI000FDC78E8|nr:T9SS type A sorting domain-containing protein [Psychroflexus aestuariivivens]